MTINFKLGDRRDIEDTCIWGRTWVGWEADQPDQETYEVNRGVWNLGARATLERFATFSHQGIVVAGVEIEGIEDVPLLDGGIKQAVIGRVLTPGEPAYNSLIGRAVDNHRNPVTYPPDDFDAGPRTCACGCGGEVTGGRVFLSGHDQKAIRERIDAGWGGTLGFISWYDHKVGKTVTQITPPISHRGALIIDVDGQANAQWPTPADDEGTGPKTT
ncbi:MULTISPECIES: hypothetical protein [unclassified Nocardia]|uniref:hypothetical protein n=1 Tax=unclassified Nocardia TaxID=2637762 RepID=UPI001CE406B1|nr:MULTISPECIES: hypothetical protein [unclassified Nocardia]